MASSSSTPAQISVGLRSGSWSATTCAICRRYRVMASVSGSSPPLALKAVEALPARPPSFRCLLSRSASSSLRKSLRLAGMPLTRNGSAPCRLTRSTRTWFLLTANTAVVSSWIRSSTSGRVWKWSLTTSTSAAGRSRKMRAEVSAASNRARGLGSVIQNFSLLIRTSAGARNLRASAARMPPPVSSCSASRSMFFSRMGRSVGGVPGWWAAR